MNRKGIALNVLVDFIIVGVAVVILLLLLLSMGLLNKAIEMASMFVCMTSSLVRSVIIAVSLSLLTIVTSYLVFVSLMSFRGSLGFLKSADWGKWIKAGVIGGKGVLSIAAIIFSVMIFGAISNIPLTCSVMDTHEGTIDKPVDVDNFNLEFASKVTAVYDMFLDGHFDPLLGINPNPRTAAVMTVYLDKETDFKSIYNFMLDKYSENWKFEDTEKPNIYLFCYKEDNTYILGNDISSWDRCSFKDAIITIKYLDTYSLQVISFLNPKFGETNFCSGFSTSSLNPSYIPPSVVNIDKDSIVICVKVLS